MKTGAEQAIDVLSKDLPVYRRVPVAGESVEAEIFIPNFGYVIFVSGSQEIRVRTCTGAGGERIVKVANALSPFGNIVVTEL